MARQVLLLRGINIGSRNRIAMPGLRAALEEAGFADVRTYVQSGNVVASAGGSAEAAATRCEQVIADRFGLEIAVVAGARATRRGRPARPARQLDDVTALLELADDG